MTIFMMLLIIVEILQAVVTMMMLGTMFLGSAVAAMMILTKMTLAWGRGRKAASQCIVELKQHYGSFSKKRRGAAGLGWAGGEKSSFRFTWGDGQTFPVWMSSFTALGRQTFAV